MRVIGIDQGTTSTRAIAIDATGQLQVLHAVEHKQSFLADGMVEQDPEELIRNIRACITAAGQVDAIGIDNQGESCVAWDAITKEALCPVISWQDNRTIDALDKLKACGQEKEVLARAGLPIDPYFSASKLGWMLANVPAVKHAHERGTLRLGTTDAFFLDRLTGRCVTDVSTASRTSLMNLETLQWDETLCEMFGVPIDCLPAIRPTTGNFGAIDGVPVTASVVDQQAALYGFGCRAPGDAKITFGTGAFALAVTGSRIIHKPDLGLLPTVAWQMEGQDPVYALDGGVFTASSAVNWARSLGLFTDFGQINSFDGPTAMETGLAFVPALAGLGCPHWAANAKGVWLGLSLAHGPETLVQSILEGVAFRAAEVIGSMDQCVTLTNAIPVDGGMSNNPYFVQFLADVSGRQIKPAKMPELTGLGTILLACEAIGHVPEVLTEFGQFDPITDHRPLAKKFNCAIAVAKNWQA